MQMREEQQEKTASGVLVFPKLLAATAAAAKCGEIKPPMAALVFSVHRIKTRQQWGNN